MIPLLAGAGPRWFNIPAHRPFVHDLARGLFDALAPLGPQAVVDGLITDVDRFLGGKRGHDDITLVVLQKT